MDETSTSRRAPLIDRTISSIKKGLRKSPLYRVLAPIRASQITRTFNRTAAYYASRKPVGSCSELLTAATSDRVQRLRSKQGRLNVLYVGADRSQDYSGIIQGLSASAKVAVFTRENGDYGQYLPDADHGTEVYSPQLQHMNGERLLALMAELHAQHETPDIVLGQMWAGWIDGAALRELASRFGALVVNLSMDDRHVYSGRFRAGGWTGPRGLIPYVDLVLTATPDCVDWYLKEGRAALFFPEASDPTIFHPLPEAGKTFDVSFVGARYGIREDLVSALRRAGINVAAFGSGWERGRLDADDVPRVFAASKIVLGVGTVSHCRNFCTLKMRDFDATMSGSFYLTTEHHDLHRVFDVGRELVVYRSVQDCIDKARYFLAHEDEREAIASRGLERARESHTWQVRFAGLFEWILDRRNTADHSGSVCAHPPELNAADGAR